MTKELGIDKATETVKSCIETMIDALSYSEYCELLKRVGDYCNDTHDVKQQEKVVNSYVRDVLTTKSQLALPPMDQNMIDLLHGVIGVSTEAAELLDPIKKFLFYHKSIDTINLQEEIGDLFWYIAIITNALGVNWQMIMNQNIAKLQYRYPEKFSKSAAVNRNLDGERKILED